MFTRIDHLMICVPDLERGTEHYRRMGFNVQPGGVHPGKGTHNAIAFNEEDYLELLAIRDPAEERAASAGGGELGRDLAGFIAAGGGIRYVILQSDDLAADVAAMRAPRRGRERRRGRPARAGRAGVPVESARCSARKTRCRSSSSST